MASLAASLLSFPLAAEAGTFSGPNYTDKGQVSDQNGVIPSFHYRLYSSSDSVTGTSQYGFPGYPFYPAVGIVTSSTDSGPITATFTWQPAYTGEPLPQSVIVVQHSVPQAGTAGTTSGSARVVSQVVQTGLPQNDQVDYSAQSGAGSISVTCSPTASIGVTAGSSGGQIQPYADVTYSASVSPVTLNLGGAIKDSSGNYNILVGQGCTASISGIPAALLNNTANPPTYQWSVSGNAFQRWAVTYVAGQSSSAVLTKGYGPNTNSTAHWYWSDNSGQQTVKCTVTLTPPTGQGAPITLNLSQTVALILPTINVVPVPGRVQINNLEQSLYGAGYYLYDGPGNGSNAGITWQATISTPPLFPQNASIWNFVQIVTPKRSRTISGGSSQPSVLNGQYGLDTTYPYEPGPYSATFPGGYGATNVPDSSGDSPAVFLSDIYTNYQVTDTFSTYVMYNPPGGDTQWVPLWEINWYWYANDSITPGTSWMKWNNANDAGIVRAPNSESQTVHPVWSTLVLAPPTGVF